MRKPISQASVTPKKPNVGVPTRAARWRGPVSLPTAAAQDCARAAMRGKSALPTRFSTRGLASAPTISWAVCISLVPCPFRTTPHPSPTRGRRKSIQWGMGQNFWGLLAPMMQKRRREGRGFSMACA